MAPRWQRERDQLNHNWLQNVVLMAANHALGVTAGAVIAGDARQTLAEDIRHWRERGGEISVLLDRLEAEMSPAVYFKIPPMSLCPDDTKRWLVPLTHELWRRRNRLGGAIARARACHSGVESVFQDLTSLLDGMPQGMDAASLKRIDPVLQQFTSQCRALSGAISALPREVTL